MEDLNCWKSKFEPCIYANKLINKIIFINSKTNNKVNLDQIKKAIYYARKYHDKQKRETGEPYYSHPLEVADMVSDYIFNTDILITCILHDILEDTCMTKEMLNNIFSLTIANNVEKLTKIKFNKKFTTSQIVKSLWLKSEYELLIVKQMDRLHNMQSIFIKNPDKIKKNVSETIEIFIILSIYFELNDVESQLTKLCNNFLPKQSPSDEFHLFLTYGENVQLLAPIFQNEAIHTHNLYLTEKI